MTYWSIYWALLAIFTLAIAIWFIKLYCQQKERRKLMFSLAFFASFISYFYLILGLHTSNTTIFNYNIFQWTNMPIIFAILIAVNDKILKGANFNNLFKFFIVLYIICFIMIFLPINLIEPINILRQIITIEIVAIIIYLFYKNHHISNLLFLFSLFCYSLAGITLNRGQEELSIFSFFMANIFIALVFAISNSSESSDDYSMGTFFSLKKRLEGTEQALAESMEKFRLIVENSNDAIMLTKPDGAISYVSPAAKEVLGYEPGELVKTGIHFFHPEDKRTVLRSLTKAKLGKSRNNLEYRIITQSGENKWVSHSWAPIMRDDGVHLIVSIIRDISEKKRAEEELHKTVSDLERFNRVAVGRELQMIDLKSEINELLLSMGRDEKYIIPS